MFIEIIIFSIILGYILKGKLSNLEKIEVKGLYLIFIGFFIEFSIVMLINKGILHRGILTYILDLTMYIMIFVFTYINKGNRFIIIMGTGFLLNAVAIFLNGGAMPVSTEAIKIAGITENVTREGLYRLIDENTRLWFLGDIIPLTFLRNFAISVGDIVAGIGLGLFIITGMRKGSN